MYSCIGVPAPGTCTWEWGARPLRKDDTAAAVVWLKMKKICSSWAESWELWEGGLKWGLGERFCVWRALGLLPVGGRRRRGSLRTFSLEEGL